MPGESFAASPSSVHVRRTQRELLLDPASRGDAGRESSCKGFALVEPEIPLVLYSQPVEELDGVGTYVRVE